MALTAKITATLGAGGIKLVIGFFALDNNYPAGGYPVSGALFGINSLDGVFVGAARPGGLDISFDPVTSALRANQHQHTENVAAVYTQNALSAVVTPAQSVEVPAATDLSAFSNVPFIAVGQ